MIQCRLKSILREHNLTQKELCEAIKARPSTICDLCNNNAESIRLSLVEDICKHFNCNISDLFFFDMTKAP